MKKLLIAIFVIATLSICSLVACKKDQKEDLVAQYVEQIKKELQVSEDSEDYCYTYQEVEPKQNDAHIVDFYYFGPTNSISTWICIREDGQIDCDMLQITFYN